jgi:aminopeptidase
MPDPRKQKLAETITNHSLQVKPGERVLIETFDIPAEFTSLLIRTIAEAGGVPLCLTKNNRVLRALYNVATEEQMRLWGEAESHLMRNVEGYVGIRGTLNSTELSDVPPERLGLYQTHVWQPVHIDIRCRKTKWVVLRWPTPSMAQQARLSTEAFENFYFDVCTVDYESMAAAMRPLVERMTATKDVHITGPGTDLRFSVAGIPAVGCAGERNIPDGEVFTCPVKESVEGTLTVNASSLYQGVVFENVVLKFEGGRIVSAEANHTERLNTILDTDEGARYIGEFSLAFNPRILQPMMDILFDEKIAGSFHFTPGQAYEEADNGNRSEVHWDLVTIQRPDYGGGEIYFDGELVRKDGQFVVPELAKLNPG